ncbi:MAG: peroxide stress protein YaaA [Traorella sp.]
MKIILSPAKKMNEVDFFSYHQLPLFLDKSQLLLNQLSSMSLIELQKMMKCNDKIAQLNYERYQKMNLYESLSPALFTYEGLAFQHLRADIMSEDQLAYLEKHLYILSGFYGLLRPFDGICCYRLEMQSKLDVDGVHDLYEFWSDEIANELFKDDDVVINLASKEYSSCIIPYLNGHQLINIQFVQESNGKIKTFGTEAKMCRGAMVRYMAEKQIEDIDSLKQFSYLGYQYDPNLSSCDLVFVRKK